MVSRCDATGSAMTGPRIIAVMPVFICSMRAFQPAMSFSGGNGGVSGRAIDKAACASGLTDFGTGITRSVRRNPPASMPVA